MKKLCMLACMLGTITPALAHNLQELFTYVYERGIWGDTETLCGHGSKLSNTIGVRAELPLLLAQYGIQSMLDIPCGDCNWIRTIDLPVTQYIGADIVVAHVENNHKKYTNSQRSFIHRDATCDPLPRTDLIMCRDCLAHLSDSNIVAALRNFKKSGATYLLATTFTTLDHNEEITGIFRPVNLQLPPFNFPPPLHIIHEYQTWGVDKTYTKCLGLWKLSDLPIDIE